ncbi:MAG: AMP-binding protein [Parvibaculum sp.]|uniref:AMP-binding protein n=1 Tax=Parvibaculum sp. TaxID=2024848 RepID=UPI003C757A27
MSIDEQKKEAAERGGLLAFQASLAPARLAIESEHGRRSFGELAENCNRIVRALRARGIKPGDGVAIFCSNRPEFVEVLHASLQAGFRFTPVNWHLTPDEACYIIDDCEARAVFIEARFVDVAKEALKNRPDILAYVAIDGVLDGYEDYETVIVEQDGAPLEDTSRGQVMLYTSGTTGRPKGVYRRERPPPSMTEEMTKRSAAFKPESDLVLVTGPLYHSAPMNLNLTIPLLSGVGVVLMTKWDAEETLRLVARHGITHTHMVPTMFHRLLQLPEPVRESYDLSTLRWILHGAAPCPAHAKQAMIEWLGPCLYEYYAGTEGGGTFIYPEEWLKKPGSVGRATEGTVVRLVDENGDEVPQGETGTIYFKAPATGRFSYFKAEEKTAESYRGDFFTMGDMGYVDEDGYYFLTGRSAELIISGGVNIYPQETDSVLLQHPAVAEVCTIGIPNEEWGEEVKSVVNLNSGYAATEETAAAILGFARANLPTYKCPRSIDFASDALPRLPTGKILRRQVREPYWEGRAKKI